MTPEDIKVFTDTSKIPDDYYAAQPIRGVMSTGDVATYVDDKRFELVPGVGLLQFIEGATFPRKAIPREDILLMINVIKEVVKQATHYPLLALYGHKRLVSTFNSVFERGMPVVSRTNPHYMCYASRMMWYAGSTFLKELGYDNCEANRTGYNAAHLFEVDDAYRYRSQDVAELIDFVALRNNPRKEIRRVFPIYASREVNRNVPVKVWRIVRILLLLLLIPKYKQAFIKTIPYLEGLRFDPSDWYWTAFKDNYHFGGITHEERLKDVQVPNMYRHE